MGSFVWFLCSFPELWFLNCLKKCIFCNFVITSARTLRLFKQFTYMHLKGSPYILSENGIVCYAMSYCFGDIRV